MDQEIGTPRVAHAIRLALAALGLVLGFLLLGAVFGATSASAAPRDDDPLPALDASGLGATAGETVHDIVAPLAPSVTAPVTDAVAAIAQTAPAAAITQPVAAIADERVTGIATAVLGPDAAGALGGGPVGALLSPLTGFVDDALAGAAGTLTTFAAPIGFMTDAAPAALAAVTSPAATAGTALSGAANGVLDGPSTGLGEDPASGDGGSGSPIPLALPGVAFIALLALRRRFGPYPGMPGAPVYETDSSPD